MFSALASSQQGCVNVSFSKKLSSQLSMILTLFLLNSSQSSHYLFIFSPFFNLLLLSGGFYWTSLNSLIWSSVVVTLQADLTVIFVVVLPYKFFSSAPFVCIFLISHFLISSSCVLLSLLHCFIVLIEHLHFEVLFIEIILEISTN